MALQRPLSSLLVKPSGPLCQMRCEYCFYLKTDPGWTTPPQRMRREVLAKVIEQGLLEGSDHFSFFWQGGEPTLCGLPFFADAIEMQNRHRRPGQEVANALQTNGLLIDDAWAHFLASQQFLVGLSLDGPPDLHDRWRRGSAGEATSAAVRHAAQVLLRHGVPTNVLAVVTPQSVLRAEEIYAFFKSEGLTYMQFIPCVEQAIMPAGEAAEFSVSALDYGRFLCVMLDCWLADFTDGVPATSIRNFEEIFFSYMGELSPACTLRKTCGEYVVVEHDGSLYSCDFFVDATHLLGNVMTMSMRDALNSPAQLAFGLQKMRGQTMRCLNCRHQWVCQGGCLKDRLRFTRTCGHNALCEGLMIFWDHADQKFRRLAQNMGKHSN